MTEQDRRVNWIDIAKGLSIIFVVMGHSGDYAINHYLGWFRMPLFFALSGFLFKPVAPGLFAAWARKRIVRLLIPYFAYGLLIAFVILCATGDISEFAKQLVKLPYGGQLLTGPFGVFWFITCLLVTQVAFGFLSRFSTLTVAVVIAVCYAAAHLFVGFKTPLPWNADVALMALPYYAMGFYLRGVLVKLVSKVYTLLFAAAVAAAAVLLDANGAFTHAMDMKYKEYHNPLLDVAIALSIVTALCSACYWLSKIPAMRSLQLLGTNTITIMYLHIPVNLALKSVLHTEYGIVLFTLIGVSVPLLASIPIRRSGLLSRLYLGVRPQPALAPVSMAKRVSA